MGVWPLESVAVSDREPRDFDGEGSHYMRFGWHPSVEGQRDEPDDLPRPIFERLDKASPLWEGGVYYPTAAAAREALGAACLAWARG